MIGEYHAYGLFWKGWESLSLRGFSRRSASGAGGWRAIVTRVCNSYSFLLFAWAVVLAIAMSTQFLFQPFVWRNWGWDEILPAWLGLVRDRLIVALCIATTLVLFPVRRGSLGWRMIVQAIAIVAGATVGELVLRELAGADDRQDMISFAGRIARWTLVGGAISTLIYFWRSGSEMAALADDLGVNEARLRRVAASARLEMLKRQIEPHFLFNTLATIRRLQETDPARSQSLLGRLFDYMAATLHEEGAAPETLRTEATLVLAYLDVCASRLSGGLEVRCDIAPDLADMRFPPLVLATLAENAVKHGIFPHDGGVIEIIARRDGDMVEVAITDDGVGFGETIGGSGIGLANISERLRLLHGPRSILRLTPNSPRGVRASVMIPATS